MASDVEFRLLGAVEFRIDGRWHSVVPFRSRQVLALLLCARRGVVLTERIVDALWGDDMPLTPSGLVRNYVMKLRRALPASASIITRNGGYQLDVDPETVDAVRFERCLQQARRSSDGVRAEELLEEALSYWRGPALADARHSAVLEAEARAMEELRLTAQQQRVELLVERASFAEAVSELRPLLASHLDWEHLSELAMVALARDGRPAEALDAFARFCDHRRSRLGLDPSDRMTALQLAVLRGQADRWEIRARRRLNAQSSRSS